MKEEDVLAKACKVVEAAEMKVLMAEKHWFEEAAKRRRKWRLIGKLGLVIVHETGKPVRELRRPQEVMLVGSNNLRWWALATN